MSVKIPRFRGGVFWVFWGGGECRFYFYGRGDFCDTCGRFPICSEMSRFVPVSPLLSFLGHGTGTDRDKRGQTGTKQNISGQIGKRPHVGSTPI